MVTTNNNGKIGFGNMKRIQLTQGKYALVDDEDYEWLNQWKWHIKTSKKSNTYYAVRTQAINGKKKHIKMHRQILNCTDNLNVDHINRKGFDNQRKNLRTATHQQNMMNRKGDKNSSSKYKGVRWDKNRNVWLTQIIHNGKRISKRVASEILAAKFYDYWANKYHREFAYLNFPNELLTDEEFKNYTRKKKQYSKYVGVTYDKKSNFWFSRIRIKGKRIHIGIFKIEIEAAKARNKYIINNNLNTKIYKLNEI